jgi:AraC-like DNA-binding protein
MSPYHLCKVFKKSTGLTFTAYLARVRIEAVKRILHDVNKRISEAAFAAGFQSLSQFNRIFRRLAGEAPSRYRNRLHGLHGMSARYAHAQSGVTAKTVPAAS